MVATMGALMTVTHIAKLMAFGFIGFAIGNFLPLMGAMIVAGVAGNWIGEMALHRISEQRFRLVLQVILTVLALRLIWSAGVAAGIVLRLRARAARSARRRRACRRRQAGPPPFRPTTASPGSAP